jgi:glyoxylase-like metal-dependent hydrolase (beta-lactamase superfamily II)
MRLDRVAEDIYIFISERYLQVVSTVLLTEQGAVVVDAFPFPADAAEVLSFVEQKLGHGGVRYVINTHHHADHVNGTYLFEGAEVVAHAKCRELLAREGIARLERAKRHTPALAEVEIVLPGIAFEGEMDLHLGHRHMRLFHTPGHTADGISVFVAGEKVLVAGDVLMPVPYLVDGNIDQLRATLRMMRALRPGFIVQGHGDVLLRGEVNDAIDGSLRYIDAAVHKVRELVQHGASPSALRDIDIESCGLSRIPLDGLVTKLHLENLVSLYKRMTQQEMS